MRKRYYLLFLLLVFVSAIAFPAFKGETQEVVPIKTANYTRPAAAQSLGALYNRSPAGGMYVGLKQNMSGLFYSAHTPAFYATTNNKGLRNDPFPRQKHSNSTRILIVGDSFTFGAGVNTSQTFPEILEDMFNKNQDRHYEVINGGIFSVGLKNYYFFLKEKGIHYQPDTVVVAFTNGDSISREREEQLTEQVKTNPPRQNRTGHI